MKTQDKAFEKIRQFMQIPASFEHIKSKPLIYEPLLVLCGSWLIAAGAYIQVPMFPVPMTMQSLAVLLIGSFMSSRLSALTVGVYLMQGAFGLPFFAGGSGGVLHLIGPTGGYLAGYLIAVLAMGHLRTRGFLQSNGGILAILSAGTFILFFFGLVWLSFFTGWGDALKTGLYPFIPGLFLKMAAAFCIIRIVQSSFKNDNAL